MMRKFIKNFNLFFTVIFLWFKSLSAQQLPQYTNYLLNYHALNPAAAGSTNCLDLKVGVRTQWVGFEGAPKTQFLQANSFLKRKRKLSPNIKGISLLPRMQSFIEEQEN